jgi:(1->4)-alpha-D-glucan 1-alpha-D-glucosylmutase
VTTKADRPEGMQGSIAGSTYRLQFREGMTFEKAAALAPYLARLGVTHLYASPIFAAAPWSTHGYDVVDLRHLAPELGGDAGFEALSRALKDSGLGLILDFVPNHMGANTYNPWWFDVLEWGEASRFTHHFDIDWSAPRLIIPVLGSAYGDELAKGSFSLSFDAESGGISFCYGPIQLPLTPPSYAHILARTPGDKFAELARRLIVVAPEDAAELKQDLVAASKEPAIREAIESTLREIADDHDAIHAVHEAQIWRLTHWRAARETLTYRRFFEISDLVGLKVERSRVFDDVHAKLLQMVAGGAVQGIRLDHIDGLADPKGYLERLQGAIGGDQPFYLLVEKILGPDEDLRRDWPVAGTTGYEFIGSLANLLVDGRGETTMTEGYDRFLGEASDYHKLVLVNKRRLLTRNLAGELDALKDMVGALAAKHPATRDFGADSLRRAIIELVAALPVYRSYVNVAGPSQADRDVLEGAVEAAKATREVEDEGALTFLLRVLLLDFVEPEDQAAALEFATRFQQTTGPVMAKALEDTVFYRYGRLIGLNEVGGEPDQFGASPKRFHRDMARRLELQPLGLSATATHDTKRGEDARARLYALSEMPELWSAAVERWAEMNVPLRGQAGDLTAPDAETEWLFYQALLGAWPLELAPDDKAGLESLAERMTQFMLKAVREAKAFTSWTAQDTDYEKAVEHFTRRALDPSASAAFLQDFRSVCQPVFTAGALNGLTQTLLKLAAPGVPDIYQGTELWDFSLVDPDNRRPLDFEALTRAMERAGHGDPAALVEDWQSGAIKMRVLREGLALRTKLPDLFASGSYRPLTAQGARAENIVAFARVSGGDAVIALAPRLPLRLLGGRDVPLVPHGDWGDTKVSLPEELARRRWRNLLDASGERLSGDLPIAGLLARFPVALLCATSDGR